MVQRAHIKPELLIWARETINLSVEDAARKIGVSEERLGEWEAGAVEPTVSQLRKASRVYKRPLASFFLQTPPTTFRVPHDFRRVPGEAQRRLSPKFVVEYRLAEFRRKLALDLAEPGEDLECRWVGRVSINNDPLKLAGSVRNRLGVAIDEQLKWRTPYDALNRWRESIEQQLVLVFHFSGVEVDEVRGYAIAERQFPVIGLNGGDAPNGRIFTMMHELGHLLLGKSGISDLRLHDRTGQEDLDIRVELFCNAFAGGLLIPADALLQHPMVAATKGKVRWAEDQLRDLAKDFSVSRAVVLRRLYDVKKTTRSAYEEIWLKLSRFTAQSKEAAGGFLTPPQNAVRSAGKPFVRIVLSAYDREAITLADLAEYLGVRLKHLGKIREVAAWT